MLNNNAYRRIAGAFTALVLGCSLVACGSSERAADGALNATTRELLDKTLAEAFEKSGMPGIAASIWIGGERWDGVRGVADLSSNRPFARDDYVRIASITKTFTATAVLRLIDQGKLSLDDPVSNFVPDLPNGDRITVRQLLGMSSGLYDYTADPTFESNFAADPMMTWTPEQSLSIVRQHGPEFEPGSKVVYCDSNYVVLGLIIEKVTGQPVEDVINNDVVTAARLEKTHFPTGGAVPDPHSTAYAPPGDFAVQKVVGDVNPKVAWTAGAMTSTLDDLRTWIEELADGSLLSPGLQADRLKARRLDGSKINLGYGLGVMTLNDFIGHNGAILGYSSMALTDPRTKTTVVVVGNSATNSETPASNVALSLIGALYPDQVK